VCPFVANDGVVRVALSGEGVINASHSWTFRILSQSTDDGISSIEIVTKVRGRRGSFLQEETSLFVVSLFVVGHSRL
jgi:hypothetical protein